MKIINEIYTLDEFNPWCGAKFNWNIITECELGREFIDYIEELFPEGCTETDLNNVLWFKDDMIRDFLKTYGFDENGYEIEDENDD